MNRPLTILLLGGTGFLGTHLANQLLDLGMRVRIFSLSANSMIGKHPNLTCYQGDFINGLGLKEALFEVDVVFHFISTTVPGTSNLKPIVDVQSNLIGSLNLFEKMVEAGVNRIIFISSGGTVYGNPSQLPVPETHPLHPICSYGIVKVAIENYLNMFRGLHQFETTILRIANPYGPYQNKIGVQGAIATFFQKIMKRETIKIWGDGSVVRDYIYVSDVISAMIQALNINKPGTYNIGNGQGHSLLEVINIITHLVGLQPKIEFLPERPFDVLKTYLDITKAKLELDWKPNVSLLEGCEYYWQWIKQKGGPALCLA